MTIDATAVEPRFACARDGRVLRITFTNPSRLNALDFDAIVAIGDAVVAAGEDRDVRVVVLSGTGAAFCTGADLASLPTSMSRGVTPEMVMAAAGRLSRAIVACPVPVVAQIDGPAVGFGVALALAADLTYASEDAYLLLSFVNVGLMPDGGATALTEMSAGQAKASEMALLGGRVPAAEAHAAGLFTAVLPAGELATAVDSVAERIASGPRRALQLTKQSLVADKLTRLDAALARESVGQAELLKSADFAEGATAVLQKRKPQFSA